MNVSKVALVVALAFGGVSAAQAQAQEPQQQEQAQPQLQLNENEVKALQPLQAAAQAKDWAAARAALPAAEAAAESSDARYFIARLKFVIGNQTQDSQLEAEGLNVLVQHPKTPANELQPFLTRQAELAFDAGDFATSERAFSRLLELAPNDPQIRNNLAVVRARMGNTSGALEVIEQTVQTAEAAGRRAEESAYQRLLAAAVEANQPDRIAQAATRLLNAYPTPQNWRRALVLFRRSGNVDEQMDLDLFRLQRAAGALEGEQEYVLFADQLNRGGMPGEAKAVLDEGLARNQISMSRQPVRQLAGLIEQRIAEDRSSLPAQRQEARSAANGRLARTIGDVLYGYGQYQDAVEMYRLSMEKGGVDSNLVNTRIGAALAMAGQRAEAEAALRAVTGPRQALANYWLLWLDQRSG